MMHSRGGPFAQKDGCLAFAQGHSGQGSRSEFISTEVPLPLDMGNSACWTDGVSLCHDQR